MKMNVLLINKLPCLSEFPEFKVFKKTLTRQHILRTLFSKTLQGGKEMYQGKVKVSCSIPKLETLSLIIVVAYDKHRICRCGTC